VNSLGAPPPNPAIRAIQRQARKEREAAQVAARRRDRLAAMNPRQRQLAAIEELHHLAEAADSMATAAEDPARKADLLNQATEIRRTIKRKEREMPAVDMTTPATIRAAFAAKVLTITSELAALAADDGREAGWKNRRRAEMTADMDTARQTADRELAKWATAAAREATKAGNADTRSPEDCMKDLAVEMRTTRLAASCSTQAEATNKLMGEARRLASVDFRQALSYAQAAATHGAMGAANLAAELERDYRATWPGHPEAAELAASVEREVSGWVVERAATFARAGGLALEVARRTGDNSGDVGRLTSETVSASIAAKHSAYAASLASGEPYQAPDTGTLGAHPTIEVGSPYRDPDASTTLRD